MQRNRLDGTESDVNWIFCGRNEMRREGLKGWCGDEQRQCIGWGKEKGQRECVMGVYIAWERYCGLKVIFSSTSSFVNL